MKIILTEEIVKLGVRGNIREVKDGYGRNFLLPLGKAVLFGTQAAKNILREMQEKRISSKLEKSQEKPQDKIKKSEKRAIKKQKKEAKVKKSLKQTIK